MITDLAYEVFRKRVPTRLTADGSPVQGFVSVTVNDRPLPCRAYDLIEGWADVFIKFDDLHGWMRVEAANIKITFDLDKYVAERRPLNDLFTVAWS